MRRRNTRARFSFSALVAVAAVILLAYASAETNAQTFRLNRQPCEFTPNRAATVWWLSWEWHLKDTVVAPFIGQGVNIEVGGRTLRVDFDSVKGSGGMRRVLLTFSQRLLADSAYWYHYRHMDSATSKLAPDSIWPEPDGNSHSYWRLERTMTFGPTMDSTYRSSSWFEPFDGINYHRMGWAIDDSTHVDIAFVKVTGSPTLHYGRNQRAVLKVHAKAQIPAMLDSLMRQNNQ